MPFLETPGKLQSSFNWEEIGGDPIFKLERHRILDSNSGLARSVTAGVRGTVRRDPHKSSSFRLRFREKMNKAILAIANSEDVIQNDLYNLKRSVSLYAPQHLCANPLFWFAILHSAIP